MFKLRLHLFGLGFHASISPTGVVEFEQDSATDGSLGIGVQVGESTLFVAGVVDEEGI